MNRIKELDGLRGIAAIAVVVYHYTFRFRELYGHNFDSSFDFKYGHYGVELFFILSGFVIFMTTKRISGGFDFLYKRFSRLYPPYWAAILLTYLVVAFWGLDKREVNLFEFIFNFSMIQGLFKIRNVDGVYWSLLPELIFYFQILLLIILKKLKYVPILGMCLVIISFLNTEFIKIKYIGLLFNLNYSYFFFSGILFYILKNENKENYLQNYFFLITTIILGSYTYFNKSLTDSIIVFCLFIIFGFTVFGRLNIFGNKFFVFLGSISYSFYLIHQNIGYIIITELKNISDSPLIIIPPLIVAILLSFIMYKFIELPALSFLRAKNKETIDYLIKKKFQFVNFLILKKRN